MNAERLLISSVLRGKSCSVALGFELTEEMFADCPTEWTWLMGYMTKHHRVPGLRTFESVFPDFVCEEVDDAEFHAEVVRKNYVKRLFSQDVTKWVDMLEDDELDGVFGEVSASVVRAGEIMQKVFDSDGIRSFKDVRDDVTEYHDRIVDTGYAGIPTGFKTWDVATGGCKPGEFIVVGARLGSGKSWVMTKMATTAVIEGYTVLYDSLEMTRTNVMLRAQTLLSGATGRPYDATALMSGTSAPLLSEYDAVLEHIQASVSGEFHVADTSRGRINLNTIAAQIERIRPDIVFIDYLTLLDATGEWQSVAALSNQVKQMANHYKTPIVAAAQLNRANGLVNGVAGSEALARSDSIAQDADQVMNISLRSQRVLQHKLVKNRNGAGGMTWWTEFRPGAGVIEEINVEKAQELIDEDGE